MDKKITEKEWLENLKVGDEVYISQRFKEVPYLDKVSRVTDKQIIINKLNGIGKPYEIRFWKKDGFSLGRDSWTRDRLIMPSEKLRELIEIDKLKSVARNLKDKLTIPQTKQELIDFIRAIQVFVK